MEKNISKPELTCKPCDYENHEILESGSIKKLNFQPIKFWRIKSWKKYQFQKLVKEKKNSIKKNEDKIW